MATLAAAVSLPERDASSGPAPPATVAMVTETASEYLRSGPSLRHCRGVLEIVGGSERRACSASAGANTDLGAGAVATTRRVPEVPEPNRSEGGSEMPDSESRAGEN
jgi:hypothetical protein